MTRKRLMRPEISSALRTQDATWVCCRPKNLRANIRLAKASSVYNCALFFGQTAMARLEMFEQAVDDMEEMLDSGAHAGIRVLKLFLRAAQRIFLERLAYARAHGCVPDERFSRVLRAFCYTLITGIAQRRFLIAMQQRACLRHVGDVASRATIVWTKRWQLRST